MNLGEIQGYVLGLLKADTRLKKAVFLSDDGQWPKTEGREAGLQCGLVITVFEIEADSLKDFSRAGVMSTDVRVPVLIEEARANNRKAGGTGIRGETAVQYVLENMIGKPRDSVVRGFPELAPNDPPFLNMGRVDGVNTWLVEIAANVRISAPLPA